MNDELPTAPGRVVRCTACLRQWPLHAEACLMNGSIERARREVLAREHFNGLSKLQRLLCLGIGARSRGAFFHYRGKVV